MSDSGKIVSDSLKLRVFHLLDAGHADTPFSRAFDIGLVVLISLNVLAVIVESVPGVYANYAALFDGFEIFSVTIFSIEYAFRIWSATAHPGIRYQHPLWGRIRYMLTPLVLIDLVVILPFYLGSLIGVDLRVLRALRLMRAFRLTRYASSMNLLLQVLRDEGPVISAALFVLLMLVIVAASITYLAEHETQPEAFASIPHALWWAVVTMTTIGYGDVVPMTLIGRICAAVVAIISVGMVALPAGILASGFNDALHRRNRRFETLVDDVLADGTIDTDERARLREMQSELQLSEAQAAAILRAGYRKLTTKIETCATCGRIIHAPMADEHAKPASPGRDRGKFG